MKNWIFLLLAVTSLSATPKAVVFDWGNVIASPNRSVVIKFLCEELDSTDEEFENVNIKKRIAVQAGKSEVEFWMDFAQQKGIALPADWPFSYIANLKKSVGVDAEVLALIEELKQKEIRVGLLSNIDGHYTKFLRDSGFYDLF